MPLGLTLFFAVLGLAGTAGFGWALLDPDVWSRDDVWAFGGLFAACAGMLFLAADYDQRKLVWDDQRLLTKKLFSQAKSYEWSELEQIDNLVLMESWKLKFGDGSRFGVSHRLIGVDEFLDQAVRHDHVRLHDMGLQALRDSLKGPDEPI
jgi:hypothetical protein